MTSVSMTYAFPPSCRQKSSRPSAEKASAVAGVAGVLVRVSWRPSVRR
jgi:hypothetical protein